MTLVLTVASYRGQPPAQPASQRFESTTITIGRAPDNDWTLPDPDQHLSKKHCVIQLQAGQYAITDTSTNGVFLNGAGEALGHGRTAILHEGDRLAMGGYELLVSRIGEGEATVFGGGAGLTPFASLSPSASTADDPFGIGGGGGAAPSAASGFGASPFPTDAGAVGAYGGPSPFSTENLAAGGGGSPFSVASPFSTDAAAPLAGGAAFPPAASFPSEPVPPGIGSSGLSVVSPFSTEQAAPGGAPIIPENEDWLGGGGHGGADPFARQYSEPDHVPAVQGAFRAPGVVMAPLPTAIPEDWDAPPAASAPPRSAPAEGFGIPAAAPPPPPSRAAAPSPTAGAQDAALAAFLAGAGLPADALGDRSAEVMRELGATFRAMVEGLRDVLTTRALIKTEYRVEQTVIRSTNNNPLKFSLDAEQAMQALVGPRRPGYMPPLKAVAEGFTDIKAHELAIMAGMQVAVATLIRQFDPEELKKRLEKQSVLHSILPGARKAKYWEIYEEQFRQIAGEVSEDVHGIFGRAFARAYEEQVKKL